MERVSPATAAGQAARQAALARLSQACVCEEEEGRRNKVGPSRDDIFTRHKEGSPKQAQSGEGESS